MMPASTDLKKIPPEILAKTERFEVSEFLGKGKSGYSFLIFFGSGEFVLKVMHNEPNPYYNFSGNKVEYEVRSHNVLEEIGIKVPVLLESSIEENYLIKEYIPGLTGPEVISNGEVTDDIIKSLIFYSMNAKTKGFNLDYFPANFLITSRELYYIDYEINPYSEEWNLENWGIWYWANQQGFTEYLKTGDPKLINEDINKGIPVKRGFEDIVKNWLKYF